MAEADVQTDQVEEEHLRSVNQPAHWAYLFGILAFGTILMLALIAWMGGSAG
jgi:hypothetical protein